MIRGNQPRLAPIGRRWVRLLACTVVTSVLVATSTSVASAGGADVTRVSGYEEYAIQDTEMCGIPGAVYFTTTYRGSRISNPGGGVEYRILYQDTFNSIPTDPTQTSYTGSSVFVHVINEADNAYINTVITHGMVHGSDGTIMRSSWLAPFVFTNGQVRVNISTFHFDDCPPV
ncbi:MAG: hypothetical protein LC808_19075 [Actinobacteria bacterium]|nr:hypothetical protein [Actinomycetota bacterium]